MANLCVNRVIFTGDPAKLAAAVAFFREIENKQEQGLEWETSLSPLSRIYF
ncbi:hypothetical protein SAMN05428975_1354 [Mucilaginibacter sp. OK268]|jgi:hypothetical protein|nr:hypothetical protein SAMN05428975_1354 [Mucilaginibacter sp. OK268]